MDRRECLFYILRFLMSDIRKSESRNYFELIQCSLSKLVLCTKCDACSRLLCRIFLLYLSGLLCNLKLDRKSKFT